MTALGQNRRPAAIFAASLAAILLARFAALSAPRAAAQQPAPAGEIAANLAAGRVIFCVAKDAMFAASIQGTGEPGSRPPAIVALSGGRIAVVLGAVEWNQPDSGKITRLDAELPTVAANSTRHADNNPQALALEPTDIEAIGVGLLEVIRPLTDQLHHKLDLAPDEPLVQLLLADYVENYGPEIWSLQYRIRQQNLGYDFWKTTIQRPAYYQLYPPEKGQPRTLVEVRYPLAAAPPTLLALLNQGDPGVARVRNASPDISKAIGLVAGGDSEKALPDPVANFLRGALPLAAGDPPNVTLAKLDAERGFQWLIAPQEAPPPPSQTKPRDPGAPSLRKYIPPKQ